MALITCRNLSLAYEGKTIVTDINFSIGEGDYLCIVGENGSGKSTLMRTLLGLKSPFSGEITFGTGLNKNKIGYLPQQTEVQRDFPASVKEIVMSGCLASSGFHPFYNKEQKKRAQENMEKLGISDIQNRCYRELSGGQQQRVLLARALCSASKLLILDEPAAGLDPVVTAEMYSIIEKLNKKDKITVIMVSHDIAQAVKYATHILHISEKPLFSGKTEDYLLSDACSLFNGEGKN
ncbi:MAG: metal ABC transporter ATP-binding protein [Clostridia bacterium]|nr:metal ABC transporter ATP-binding protein [Clostridia bacterium]